MKTEAFYRGHESGAERDVYLPPSPTQILAGQGVSDQPSLEKHPRPSWFRTPVPPSHGKFPVLAINMRRYARHQKKRCSHSLPREPLAKNFGVLVDEEVLDGILVTLSGSRLRERPASS
jgi:hypothetical protein